MIDLSGDGRDGTIDFVKNLEKQGVAVDAYLDSRDLSIKGKGITIRTSYLILGEIPRFDAEERIRDNDPRQERKKDIISKITEMQEDAKKQGVQIVPARHFMAIMGFTLPRVPARAEDWNSYTIRQAGVRPAPVVEKAPAKDMPAKDMPAKKEEPKKEEK